MPTSTGLPSAREVDELGLFDQPDAIVLVEWPERAPELRRARPHAEFTLAVPPGGVGRQVRIETLR